MPNTLRLTRDVLLDARRRGLTPGELLAEVGGSREGLRQALRREGVTLPRASASPAFRAAMSEAGRKGGRPATTDAVDLEIAAEARAMSDLDDRGVLVFARARDAGQTILGARLDALAGMRRAA